MNYRLLLITVLITTLAFSCDNREPYEPTLKVGEINLYAYGKNLSWEENDAISVFDGLENHRYTAETKSDTSKFISESTLSEGISDLFALYPYNKDVFRTESGLKINFPSEQNVSKSAIDTSADIYVSYTKDLGENTYLNFQEICSYFAFSVKKEYGIVKVVLSGSDNEYLAGKLDVSFSNKEPQINVLEGNNEVSVCSDDAMDGIYRVCVLPVVLQDGLNVSFVAEDGRTAHKRIVAKIDDDIESAMVFVRGRINRNPIVFENPFASLPEDPTPEDPTPEDPTPEDPTPEDPTLEDPTPEDPTPEDPDASADSNAEDFDNQELPDDFWD